MAVVRTCDVKMEAIGQGVEEQMVKFAPVLNSVRSEQGCVFGLKTSTESPETWCGGSS